MSIGVFDAIGPIMVGPSSSHTAGAMRLSQLARKIFRGNIYKVTFTLYGSFQKTYKGHGTDRALVAGILGYELSDSRVPNSLEESEKAGLIVSFEMGQNSNEYHPNTVDILVEGDGKSLFLRGESVGGGRIHISKIDEIDVDFSGEKPTLLIQQENKSGVIAHISRCVGDINISTMRVYEKSREVAFTILETDDELNDSILEKIRSFQAIKEVRYICPK